MKGYFTPRELGLIQASLRVSAIEHANNAITMHNIGHAYMALQCTAQCKKMNDLADRIEAGEFDGQGI